MSERTVWAVQSGEYSDYGVHCLFLTEDLAVQYAARINGLESDEQRRWQELEDDWPARQHGALRVEHKALDGKMRTRYGNQCFVGPFQLWDELPVVGERGEERRIIEEEGW